MLPARLDTTEPMKACAFVHHPQHKRRTIVMHCYCRRNHRRATLRMTPRQKKSPMLAKAHLSNSIHVMITRRTQPARSALLNARHRTLLSMVLDQGYALSTHYTRGIELDHCSYRLNRPSKSDFTTTSLKTKSSQLHTSNTDMDSTSHLDCFVIHCPEHHRGVTPGTQHFAWRQCLLIR